MGLIDFKFAHLDIVDGTGTPNTMEVYFGQGNFQYTERRALEYRLDRGKIATGTVRLADEEPVQVTISGDWTEIRAASGGPVTVEEALKKIGEASSWASTGGACEPYAVDLVFEYGSECNGTLGHRITFSEFRYEQIDHDATAGTLTITGSCKEAMPTVIRTTVA